MLEYTVKQTTYQVGHQNVGTSRSTAAILIFDVTNRESLDHVKLWFKEFQSTYTNFFLLLNHFSV